MKRLLVVDDVPLFLAGLTSALRGAGYDVVGEAADGESAVAMAETSQPDLVLLDVLMPGMSGIDALAKIRAVAPEAVIVLLTGSESEEDLIAAVRLGARGYIVKDMPFEQLVLSIDSVVEGGAAISPVMAGRLFDVTRQFALHQDMLGARKPTLTSRELEVLELVSEGKTSKQIGDLLYISQNTVKNHIRNILDKLGLHSRNEAVLYAVREGLIVLR